MLERLHDTLTRLGFQTAILGHVDDFAHFSLVHENLFAHFFDDLWLGDDVLDTYGEASVDQPIIDDELDV